MQTDEIEVDPNYTGVEPAGSADVTTTETPVVPPPIIGEADLEAVKRKAVEDYVAAQQFAQQQAAAVQPQQQQAQELDQNAYPKEFLDNPAKYIQEQIERGVRAGVEQQMQRVMPYVQRSAVEDVVKTVAGDLDQEAQDYIRKVAPGIDPSQLQGPALDIFKRAARDVHNEVTGKRKSTRIEPGSAEPTTIRIDQQAFNEANQDRVRFGLKPFTAKEFQDLMAVKN